MVEGEIVSVRYHSVTDSHDIHRYLALRVVVSMARKRVFSPDGLEKEPRLIGEKKLRQGYLNTYKKVDKKDPDAVLPPDLVHVFGEQDSDAPLPAGVFDQALPDLHPNQERVFELWGDSDLLRPLDLRPGEEVRLRTKGDSFFIESLARTSDSAFANYSGGQVLDGWAGKIAAKAGEDDETPIPGDEKQGVDSDEWDDEGSDSW